MVISKKTIIFNIFQGGGCGGCPTFSSGGLNADFHINPYFLDFPGGKGRAPISPLDRCMGVTTCAHAHLPSFCCLQMRQIRGCVMSRETLAMSK